LTERAKLSSRQRTQAGRQNDRPGGRGAGTRTRESSSMTKMVRLCPGARQQAGAGKKLRLGYTYTPPPLLSSFFSRRALGISTDIPFSLTHNAPCAIENPGAQVSRPARPDSCRQNKAYYSSSGCHDEAIESETSNEGPRRSCCCDSECAAADNALYATQLSFSIRSRARG